MAYLNEIQIRGEIRDARQVMEYLYQLEDQIRYVLQNLDGENIQAGAIGEKSLSGDIKSQIKAAQRTADSAATANKSTAEQVTGLSGSAVRKLGGSNPFSVCVGSEQPEGHGILWIQPGAEPDGDGLLDCAMKYIP